MANAWAGEVALEIDGRRHVMKLTLGSLAELEAALEAGLRVEVKNAAGKVVFRSGGFDARGRLVDAAGKVLPSEIAGGPMAAARAAAQLLARAFMLPDER